MLIQVCNLLLCESRLQHIRDILQRGINDFIVVRKAVKLESVEVEEDMVAELDTVDVGMRL